MKKFILILFCAIALSLGSCMTTTHIVGEGAKSGQNIQKKQWYALWGLVPLNTVDSKLMAGGAKDYTITTQHHFEDLLISAIGSYITIVVQTIEVTK